MTSDFQSFLLGAILNLTVVLVIVRFIYFPVTQDKSFVFSFLTFSTITYFVLHFLSSFELSLGFGFGLFALFSVLRYRTNEIPIREMTYLFAVIGLAVVNALAQTNDDLVKLLVANGAVMLLLFVLEKEWGFRFEASKRITYERIELVTPASTELLLADLRARTGLPVKRVTIGRIDFLRDTAEITIHYDQPNATGETVRHATSQPEAVGSIRRPTSES